MSTCTGGAGTSIRTARRQPWLALRPWLELRTSPQRRARHALHLGRLHGKQRDNVQAEQLGPALSRALEALELARWDELPDAELPWGVVTELAASGHGVAVIGSTTEGTGRILGPRLVLP